MFAFVVLPSFCFATLLSDMFIILCLCFSLSYAQAPADDVVYVLNFDSPLYVCPDPVSQSFVDASGVEVQRFNDTTSYMTGVIQFLQGLDSSTMVELLVDKETSGHYEMIVSHEICVFCNEIGNRDSLYYKYLKYFGFPEKCPFEAGPYRVQDFTAGGDDDLPVNSSTQGRYQVTMNFHRSPDASCQERSFVGCLKLDFIIEPL